MKPAAVLLCAALLLCSSLSVSAMFRETHHDTDVDVSVASVGRTRRIKDRTASSHVVDLKAKGAHHVAVHKPHKPSDRSIAHVQQGAEDAAVLRWG